MSGVNNGSRGSTTALRSASQFTLEEVVRPLAIAAMLTCVAVSFAQLMRSLNVVWAGRAMTWLVFIIALESIHAQRLLTRMSIENRDRFRFRFVEWVVIVLTVRFAVYLEYGAARLTSDFAAWATNMGSFFDMGFIINCIIVAAFWGVALALATTMQELEATPLEKMPAVTDPDHYLRTTMPHQGRVDRQSRLNRIISTFFVGGVLILLLAGGSRVDMRDLIVLRHSASSGVILNVLIYFMIGFLLISQARYTILKANWDLQDIPVLGNMGRRWLLLVMGFLALVGFISAILPVNYSVSMLDTIGLVVRWIIYIVVQVAFFILFLVSYLIGLILNLFMGAPKPDSPNMTSPMAQPPLPVVEGGGPASWWLLLRSLIFWTVLFGIVGYSLYHFAAYRLGLFQNLRVRRFLGWLSTFWNGFREASRRTARRMRERLAARLAAQRARIERQRWRYVNIHKLSPRDRVRYFYLSVLYRSAQQGLPRPKGATPLEYERLLARALPDATEPVDDLTQAFLEARYSEHLLDEARVSTVQSVWRHVRRALAAHKRPNRAEAPTGERVER
jgi:hypothetical protein